MTNEQRYRKALESVMAINTPAAIRALKSTEPKESREEVYRKALIFTIDHAEDFALGYSTAVDRAAWVAKFLDPIREALKESK